MIVDDFDSVRVAVAPHEADPPLVVDADGMLASSIAAHRFQLVSGRGSQNAKLGGRMNLEQFTESNTFKGTEAFAVVIAKELLGIP